MRQVIPKKGFSIIEVLIAIGVVSTGVLALMAVFITGSQSNQHGKDLSKAIYYARKVSEIVRANSLAFTQSSFPPNALSGLNDPVGTFRPLTDDPIQFKSIRAPKLDVDEDGNVNVRIVSGDVVPDAADDKFERSIQMNRASNTAGSYNYNMILMDVTIRWVGGRHGDGLRRVKVTSLLKSG